jgi:Tfp pilus assembly protein PilV
VAPVTRIINARARSSTRLRLDHRGGFTLAEGLIASVVLAFAAAGISASLGASYQQNESVEQMATSVALARELMEEISAKPFDDPNGTSALGPETGETSRALFDNVDDYHGYTDTTDSTSERTITSFAGTAVSVGNGQVYTRSVAVEYRTTPSGSAATSGDFALVTVTVTPPAGKQLVVSRMFARTTWVLP